MAEILGDDSAFHAAAMPLDASSPKTLGPFVLGHLVRTNGLIGAAAKLAQMVAARDRFQEGVRAVCEVAEQLADRLGLGPGVQGDLLFFNERWDGKSFLKRARGEDVPIAVRVVHVAECATLYAEIGGVEAAIEKVRERSGGAFDPRLAELLERDAAALLAPEGELWDSVVASAPRERPLEDAELDGALAAIGEFADLKSPFTVGHSAGVARLAEAAARQAGLPEEDANLLRRAGLVHDVGRAGVPAPIWEKPEPLTRGEWEQVRLHAYHGERVLDRSPGLSQLAATAALHHERCDGSGYHRGAGARGLSQPARLLAAADAFHAMTEPRPHRPARSSEAAAAELRADARAGRLDADAVEAVVAAAGGRPRRRREHVAGLTAREGRKFG
jgi:HD-GYP domain-containing protein (c-di-GMP phosphodiesterase class II)